MASLSFQAANATSGGGLNPTQSLTISVGSAIGAERLIGLACICTNVLSNGFSTVTVNGQAVTQVGPLVREQEQSSSPSGTMIAFFLAPGTANTSIQIDVAFTGQGYCLYAGVWNLSDNEGLLASASSNADDPVLDVDTADNGAVAAIALGYAQNTPGSTWAGLTERFDAITLFGSDCFTGADANIVTGSTPLGISIDWPPFNITSNSADSQSALAVSFGASAPAGDRQGTLDLSLNALTLNSFANVEAPSPIPQGYVPAIPRPPYTPAVARFASAAPDTAPPTVPTGLMGAEV
jgi:hypothetical protein